MCCGAGWRMAIIVFLCFQRFSFISLKKVKKTICVCNAPVGSTVALTASSYKPLCVQPLRADAKQNRFQQKKRRRWLRAGVSKFEFAHVSEEVPCTVYSTPFLHVPLCVLLPREPTRETNTPQLITPVSITDTLAACFWVLGSAGWLGLAGRDAQFRQKSVCQLSRL